MSDDAQQQSGEPEIPEHSVVIETRDGGKAVITPDSSGEEVLTELHRTRRRN